jgi:hypothetical protein
MRAPGVQAAALARQITLDVFATDESASVQATLYKMAQRLLTENAHIARVTYRLPNKHYIPVDMRYIGVDNLTPCVSGLPDRVDGGGACGDDAALARRAVAECFLPRYACVLYMLTVRCRSQAEVFTPVAAPR